MNHRTRSQLVWGFAMALLVACSSDDKNDDGGGAGAPSPGTGGSSTGGPSTGGSSTSPNSRSGGSASTTGGMPSSNAGAPPASGGRPAGFGGFAPAVGGNPAQGGSDATQGGSEPVATGGAANPGEPTLDGLTPEQLGDLCADARASFDAAGATETLGEFSCRTAGVFVALLVEPETDAELQQLCQETYDECQAEPVELEDDCEEGAMCPATVSEFEACVAEYPTYLDRVEMGLPSCSELTLENLEAALSFEPEPTPACAVLWEKCPALAP